MNRKPKLKDFSKISVWAEPEFASIKGNCSAIDKETDLAEEKRIQKELDEGNEWAWCCIGVKVQVANFSATDYLGCCSYKSKVDFIQNSGYYYDMVDSCLEDIKKEFLDKYDEIVQIKSLIEGEMK